MRILNTYLISDVLSQIQVVSRDELTKLAMLDKILDILFFRNGSRAQHLCKEK